MPELVILEETQNALFYDLPELPTLTSLIIDPLKVKESADPNRSTSPPKEARQIMQIRRKKMKRHLLKKYRKRMKFTLRKNKREREKRKEAAFQARLADIKAWGDNFDARYDFCCCCLDDEDSATEKLTSCHAIGVHCLMGWPQVDSTVNLGYKDTAGTRILVSL
jgi:hypothetical protein